MHKAVKTLVRTMLALALALSADAAVAMAAENEAEQGTTGTENGDASATGGNGGTTGGVAADTGDGTGGTGGGDTGGTGNGGEHIVGTLDGQGNFGQTADAIEQAGLSETLEGQGPFTVFAPTDAAWQQLPEDQRNRLMSDEGISRLRTVLSYHVVPDEIRTQDVDQMGSVTTIQGQPLEVSRDGDAVTVNDATITQPDIEASNGVVHGIDQVLMPNQ